MSIIKISNDFNRLLKIQFSSSNELENSEYMVTNEGFIKLINSIKKLLKFNKFVIIKNSDFINNKDIFELFVKQFGSFYGIVEETDIKLDCNYTGCTDRLIELHNDDAIDLNYQPNYGFIQVQIEDPLSLTMNGIVIIDELIRYLEVYNPLLLKDLYSYKIPMLSYGINYDNTDKSLLETHEPILYKIDNITMVRFDITRVKYYYKRNNISQSEKESFLIDEFLRYAKMFRKEFYLNKSDILIHNNKRTLHDRTECSFEINSDGTFNTRKIFVSFAREKNEYE